MAFRRSLSSTNKIKYLEELAFVGNSSCKHCVGIADFAYPIPETIADEHAAPLLCAGIIGFRAIKRAEIKLSATVGLYGFGGSAHLSIQVLKHWKCGVFTE